MKITIVGGGTAGWMAAAFLSRHHPTFNITVIDKEVGTPIGVGEATVLDFEPFMKECGFNFSELILNVDGSYKSGIMFPGWKNKNNSVWHPFFVHMVHTDLGYTSQWDIWAQDQTQPFSTHALPMLEVSEQNKVDIWALENYAYHVDCGKLIKYIESKINPFIQIIRSTVTKVVKDNNKITELILDNGEHHRADLYIDCTGWLSLLKEPKKVNLEHRLFCNTAIAGHIPYNDKDTEFRPYVISEAVEHGWIWKIPVKSRFGSGLVFNRNITDIETSKDFFLNHWDNRTTKDKLKVIDWTPYYITNLWEENVVSIGLSSGFIEPLESTGLAFMRSGIKRLSEKISLGLWNADDAELYNIQMARMYEDTVDFINMHYADTERTEPFWQYVRSIHTKSDTQLYYEEFLKNPNKSFKFLPSALGDCKMFNHANWLLWLIQMGYPVNKLVNLPEPMICQATENFLLNEQIRIKRSVSHADAIGILR